MNRIGDSLQHVGSNKELLQAFTSCGVEFVLIGGLAVAWYCKDREADDMDLLINPTPENSARIAQALCQLGLQGHSQDSFTKPGLQVPLKQHHYAELLTPRKSDASYSEVLTDAVDGKVFDIPVRVASPTRLICMKQQAVVTAEAQRDKHLKDIERLRNAV
ncbi:MAG: hypothetical protein JWO68_3998 [Actinomycetia bacterium]|nr:hypothetical protein [Actinomycetes bacterium]